MTNSEPHEIELTPELQEYARGVAIHEAEKICPDFVAYDDIVQEVMLKLLWKPPNTTALRCFGRQLNSQEFS